MSEPTDTPPPIKLDEESRRRLALKDAKRHFLLESVGQFTEKQAELIWRWIGRYLEAVIAK